MVDGNQPYQDVPREKKLPANLQNVLEDVRISCDLLPDVPHDSEYKRLFLRSRKEVMLASNKPPDFPWACKLEIWSKYRVIRALPNAKKKKNSQKYKGNCLVNATSNWLPSGLLRNEELLHHNLWRAHTTGYLEQRDNSRELRICTRPHCCIFFSRAYPFLHDFLGETHIRIPLTIRAGNKAQGSIVHTNAAAQFVGEFASSNVRHQHCQWGW